MAVDRVGHRESAPAVPDAQTRAQGAVVGDFDGDQRIGATDIDLLCAAINGGIPDTRFDLDANGSNQRADLTFLVKSILRTSLGDANVDGVFNSTDLILIFQAGEYEDAIVGNSGWAEGDWDCDGEFTTSDLVAAFQDGGYVTGAAPRS